MPRSCCKGDIQPEAHCDSDVAGSYMYHDGCMVRNGCCRQFCKTFLEHNDQSNRNKCQVFSRECGHHRPTRDPRHCIFLYATQKNSSILWIRASVQQLLKKLPTKLVKTNKLSFMLNYHKFIII